MPIEFVVRGEVMSADGVKSALESKAKRTKPESEPSHRGWFVAAFTTGRIEEARRAHEAEQEDGDVKKPFDELAWVRQTRKPRISRHFGVRDAALEFLGLAEKSGFVHAEIVEAVKK